MRHNIFPQPVVHTHIVYLLTLILLFWAAISSADDGVTTLLRFPQLNIRAGQPVLLKAYFHNESPKATEFTFPDSLSLRIQDVGGTTILVTAVETDTSAAAVLRPGEFLTKEYRVVLPALFQGTTEISAVDSPKTAVLINILREGSSPGQMLAGSEQETGNDEYPSLESLFSLYQPYAVNFSAYKPMYFLVGTDPEKSKFQISFKYRPFNPAGSLSQRFPGLSGLNFAYTQTSFWDLASSSAPFEDTSYKPELFFLTKNWSTRPKWMQGLFVQSGFQHESNGRGGEFSRSTNTAYINPTLIFFDADSELGLQISPKLSAYFNNDNDTNPDLADYRGNVSLEVKFGKADGIVSSTQLRFAEQGLSVQTDLSYPLSKLLKNNFDLFFQIQYCNMLAESLINYKARDQSMRIGFSIVR
ncbi:phospholipase A [Desulfobacula sp.]|uniref:phospholipase A n=1 Tax=Desulfobacula sp. TaxID=2593537 RepID=UPI0026016FFC|nr:phospholipase A [Desulfobacula sp.]